MDLPIQEQSPFNPHWYSYKLNGPGHRYEVGLGLKEKKIAWINGPFHPGKYNDLQIFRRNVMGYLDHGEKVCSDRIYSDRQVVCKRDEMIETENQALKNILSIYEVLNSRLKILNILEMPFRHDVSKHKICFFAVTNITQLCETPSKS